MKTKGMIYAASAAAFWAISGISGQILLQQFFFTANWLVSARMLVSGFVLILISQGSHKGNLFAIFKNPKDALALILFGIFLFAHLFLVHYKSLLIKAYLVNF